MPIGCFLTWKRNDQVYKLDELPCSTPIIFTKLEYIPAIFSFTEAIGVAISANESFFDSSETGLSQKVESQTKKIIPVIEAETVKAIIFFVAGDFFLNSSRLNISVEVIKFIK